MKNYIIKFNVMPTDNSWWSSYRNETFTTHGNTLGEALDYFFVHLEDLGLDVSNYAAKHPQKMYTDTANGPQQVGLIFKASTEIDNNGKWVRKYADIWAEVNEMYIPQEFTA